MVQQAGAPSIVVGREQAPTADELKRFKEGTDRLVMWAWDQTFTSSINGQLAVAPALLDVADWEVVYFQLDVIETNASTGDFTWGLSTGMEDVDSKGTWALVQSPFSNVPAANSSSVLRVTRSSTNPLRRWASWKIKHNNASSQWVRFQIKVLFKKMSVPTGHWSSAERSGISFPDAISKIVGASWADAIVSPVTDTRFPVGEVMVAGQPEGPSSGKFAVSAALVVDLGEVGVRLARVHAIDATLRQLTTGGLLRAGEL